MADEKTPKPKIELDEKDRQTVPETMPDANEDTPASEPRSAGDAVREGASRISAWVSGTFPGNERAFWGGVVGLLAALVFFAIGFWRTVVIAVLVLVGIAVGQALDGDPKIVNALRHIFTRNNQ